MGLAWRTQEKLAEKYVFSPHTLGKLLNSIVVDKLVCISLHYRHFDKSRVKKLWILIAIG
jgi:hypothetical protein